MYHQQQLHGHNQHLSSSRHGLPPEKQFLLQGGGGSGDAGLVLSTDAKPRLKWTAELHERFVEAVHQLGGPDKATPKTIMRLMGIPGLTLYHLKSHLQKYRLSKNLQAQANSANAKNVLGCRTGTDKACEGSGSPASHLNLEPHMNRSMHISEALQMQIQVQRRLHEQLEVQRHLQLRIEAQGKYLQSVLEKAQEALAKQSVDHLDDLDGEGGVLGTAAETQQLSALISRASAAKHEHLHLLHHHHPGPGVGVGDGSVDSCLTACEGSQSHHQHQIRDQQQDDMLSIGLSSPAPRPRSSCYPFGEAAARSGNDRRGAAAASRCEELLFLEEPAAGRRRGSSAAADEQQEEEEELDLNINDRNAPRPSASGTVKIDLNGSTWN
ncbi:hypothetical protein U9M48_016255 [Paspalum notatum var. saurae]|uniref:HTH myb-type domain-containing protein n=1 Tax=Paspalum notatum var. saurae TaxID=547442 RepID=A0AAQ3WMX4_PASNO